MYKNLEAFCELEIELNKPYKDAVASVRKTSRSLVIECPKPICVYVTVCTDYYSTFNSTVSNGKPVFLGETERAMDKSKLLFSIVF